MSNESRLADLEAYEQIRQIAANYSHGVDKQDRERFASIWHDDAKWRVMPDTDFIEGKVGIMAAVEDLYKNVVGPGETHHWSCNHAIELNGDTATGVVDADCVMMTPEGDWFRVGATYIDHYARRDGRWALTQREAQIHHYLPLAKP